MRKIVGFGLVLFLALLFISKKIEISTLPSAEAERLLIDKAPDFQTTIDQAQTLERNDVSESK